jgi:hypothetical protein
MECKKTQESSKSRVGKRNTRYYKKVKSRGSDP